ncbi:condensation domain-containing protein [Plantactinospora sp. KBS50]|uniref:condensation domain-containing protein n=1 Tax=Plantactinospora sp. KBS50 TaxID=2024580 RepID=UPI0018DF9BEF|nr:condensation domain-containing protein [Plantactinospora sp. KBS50]
MAAVATYPMTVEQQSIWLDEALHDGPSRYLESWVYRLAGQVDERGVDWTYRELVRRHEGLRSRYLLLDDELVQQVLPPERAPGAARRACSPVELDAELRRLVSRPLDLTDAPVRATLLCLAEDDVVLVVQFHHIVVDDWAVHVLEQEFEECYRAWLAGRPVPLGEAPQPGRYALTQRRGRPAAQVRAYWRDQLAELPPDAAYSLPPDSPGPAHSPGPADRPGSTGRGRAGGARLRFALEPAVRQRIRAACKQLRVTPFVLFAAAVGALLAARTGSSDAVVGTPVSRRGSAESDRMVAYLTQVLPLRLRVDTGGTFAELVGQTKRVAAGAMTHRDITAAELTQPLRRSGAGAPVLTRTVLVLDDDAAGMDLPGVTAEPLPVPSGASKYDLLLTLVARGRGYQGFLDYAGDRYTERTARRFADELAALLAAATDDPQRPLDRLLAAAAI